jgi:peptidoglycan/LPS O-acetylase OafA/YrhL
MDQLFITISLYVLVLALMLYFALALLLHFLGPALLRFFSDQNHSAEIKPQPLPARFPSLDGWRALSILLVLGQHSIVTFDFPKKTSPWFKWFVDGNLGVRFFFVISGFLITYLLLKEHLQTGNVVLRKFYARRALRILPVYFVYLTVVFGLQMFTPMRQPAITWIGNLTFTTNLVPQTWVTLHLWTIAIEEQFYLLWPGFLCLAGLQNSRRLVFLLTIPVVVSPACKALFYTGLVPPALSPFFQMLSSLFYFDSLAICCMTAILFVKYNREIVSMLSRFGGACAVMGAGLVVIPHILTRMFPSAYFFLVSGSIFQAVGFATLLLQSILFPRYFKPLNWAIVRQIGVLSYSIYIWQMIFCADPAIFGLPHVWFMSFYFWLAPAFLVALVSYYCFEKPLMALRARFRP